jgi:site-specific recombinase XerC
MQMRADLDTTAGANQALPAVVADDRAAALAFAQRSKADETVRAYRHDFRIFEVYCTAHGHLSMPSTPSAVAEFLAGEQRRGCKASTLTRRVAAIRYAHGLKGHPSPTDDERVRAVLGGIKREIGTRQTPKTAATADLIQAMLTKCPNTMTGKRDRALIALGFAGAFRRSELVALEVADLTETPDGFRALVKRSKTDQGGQGQEIAILRGRRLRPVEAVQTWLAAAGITDGPVFRQVNKSGRVLAGALKAGSVATVVKKAAKRVVLDSRWIALNPEWAAIDPSGFAGHSLRSGFLSSAAKAHASIFKMMDVSRHKSVETLRRYVHDAEAFQDHAGEDFL